MVFSVGRSGVGVLIANGSRKSWVMGKSLLRWLEKIDGGTLKWAPSEKGQHWLDTLNMYPADTFCSSPSPKRTVYLPKRNVGPEGGE